MVTSSLGICAGSVNKLMINHCSVAEVLLYKNRQSQPAQIQKSQLIVVMNNGYKFFGNLCWVCEQASN